MKKMKKYNSFVKKIYRGNFVGIEIHSLHTLSIYPYIVLIWEDANW